MASRLETGDIDARYRWHTLQVSAMSRRLAVCRPWERDCDDSATASLAPLHRAVKVDENRERSSTV